MKSNFEALDSVDFGVECLIRIKDDSSIRKKPADHTKVVNGNAKHAQKSTENCVVGSWEAVSHCLNLPIESRFDAATINIALEIREAKERIRVTKAEVRVYVLPQASSICSKPTESLPVQVSKLSTWRLAKLTL